jgi:hypothetical protein
MSEPNIVDKKIKIQGHGIKITPELKQQIANEGYYPIALTWLTDDITGPFSFTGYGEQSPFELRRVDDRYAVFENGEYFTDATFYKKPRFFDRLHTAAGRTGAVTNTVFIDEGMSGVITPCGVAKDREENDLFKITQGRFPYVIVACYNGLVVWPAWGCLYTKAKNQCKFCCIPGDYDEHKLLHTDADYWTNLGEAFAAAVEEIGPEISRVSLTVDSGTLPGRDKGAHVYIQVLETIKRRLGYLPDLLYRRAVIEPPLDFEWLQRLADAGFTDIQMDVDVYDDAERRKVMPNAKGHRPIGDYIKAFRKAKEIFPGEVATQLVAGIQDDASLLKGVEHFAREGIPTLLTPFLPFGHGRAWRDTGEVDVPSAERMKVLYHKAAAILTRHNVPPPQFRGGVSSLAETMGRRLKRVKALTNPHDLVREPYSAAA